MKQRGILVVLVMLGVLFTHTPAEAVPIEYQIDYSVQHYRGDLLYNRSIFDIQLLFVVDSEEWQIGYYNEDQHIQHYDVYTEVDVMAWDGTSFIALEILQNQSMHIGFTDFQDVTASSYTGFDYLEIGYGSVTYNEVNLDGHDDALILTVVKIEDINSPPSIKFAFSSDEVNEIRGTVLYDWGDLLGNTYPYGYYEDIYLSRGGASGIQQSTSVPDASIMLLLGSSLIGLAVFSRKSKRTV